MPDTFLTSETQYVQETTNAQVMGPARNGRA